MAGGGGGEMEAGQGEGSNGNFDHLIRPQRFAQVSLILIYLFGR